MSNACTRFLSIVRSLRSALAALTLAVALPAAAQPAVGSIHRNLVPLGSGSSVALPEGSWELTHSAPYTTVAGTAWQLYVLRNQSPDAGIPYLVVRHSTTSRRWGATSCESQNPFHFMVNQHGTRSNDLLNKCSRFFSTNDVKRMLDNFPQHDVPDTRAWWKDAVAGLQGLRQTSGISILFAELRVQLFNQPAVHVEVFLYPPRDVRAPQFRQRFLDNKRDPEHDILSNWASIYIESMQKTFFDRKPQGVMPLAYTPNLQRGPVATQLAAASPAPAQTPATPAATPTTATTAAPVATPAPAPAPMAAAAPPSADTQAQRQRLENERHAFEQERQQVAHQLEAMRQMLARLQQENAAAVAAASAAATLAQEAQNRAAAASAATAAAPQAPAPAGPVVYAQRKALVIGNDNYAHVSKLNNAIADAEAMAKSLEAVGYRVTKHVNLEERRFKQVLRDFRQNVEGGDEVLFFFAGHGVQLSNANYLLPVDIRGDGEDQVKDESILLQKVLEEFDEKKAKFTLAVIDACRDNPFKTKGRAIGGRGLAPTSAATGQMVMFSAGAGQQALDRLGDNDKERNGLFTRIFVKEMQKPGLSVDRVLRNVRNEVVRLAKSVGHEQTPALYDQAIGEFYFRQ